jgi:hypothetical protein
VAGDLELEAALVDADDLTMRSAVRTLAKPAIGVDGGAAAGADRVEEPRSP